MMKKKVMLIVPMLHQGGFERVCVRTARLLEEKCDITIVLFNDEDICFDISGLRVINLDVKSQPGRLRKILNVMKRARRLRKIKKELGIEISYSFGLTANLVNVHAKVKDEVWVGIRGYDDLLAKTCDVICNKADKIICCSKTIQEEVNKRYEAKVTMSLYNPFSIKEIKQQAEEIVTDSIPNLDFDEHKVIMAMGRDDEVKGFGHLVKSFSKVVKDIPEARLVIIGDGTFEKCKDLARRMGILEQIIFPGVKRNPFPFIKKAALFAMTSRSEGFPNALVEAMALGIPVISTNCASGPAEILSDDFKSLQEIHDIVESDYGILTPVFSPLENFETTQVDELEKMYAKEMITLLTNQEKRVYYSQKAVERASEFSNEVYVKKLLENM